MKKLIYYLPRIVSILMVAFFAIFILEGFGAGAKWQDGVFHFILALVVLLVAITAWKLPKIGGFVFIALGIFFFFFFYPFWWNGLIIGGLPLMTGFLFLRESK